MDPTRKDRFPPSEISWAAIEFERLPNPLWAKTFIYLTAFIVCIGIGFSLVAKVPLTAEGNGRMTSIQAPVPIRAAAKMTVSELKVYENKVVTKGEVLIESMESLSPQDVGLLKRYVSELSGIDKWDLIRCGQKCISRLKDQARAYQSLHLQGEAMNFATPVQDHLREILLGLQERLELANLTADMRAQIAMDNQKIAQIKSRQAEVILAKEFEALNVDLVQNQTRIKERYQKSNERISSAQEQVISYLTDLENKIRYFTSQFVIKAPFSGTVSNLSVKGKGEVLTPGQDLMVIVPKDSELIAELEVENRDISDVQPGQTADLVIDSLPEYEYGTVKGVVLEFTRKEKDSSVIRNLASIEAPVFVARIKLSSQSLTKDGVVSPFIFGMTLHGHVTIRTESIFNVVMRALFRLKEGLRQPKQKIGKNKK